MTISRRDVLLGATAAAALAPIAARAEAAEVLIGIIYPFSGASAQQGVDAQKAYEVAAESHQQGLRFRSAAGARAKVCPASAAQRSVWSSPTTSPIRRRAAPRPSA